jgi:hypothetical protein
MDEANVAQTCRRYAFPTPIPTNSINLIALFSGASRLQNPLNCFYKLRMRTGEFSQKTITTLYKRAGEQCSLCPKITSKPHSDPEKFHNLGEAAHIHGLKEGPHLRYDPNLTPTELSNIRNGIWLCRECHKIIDNDSKEYTADALRKIKQDHENRIDGKHDQRALIIPFTAPKLQAVANYVPRKELFENIKQLLLSPQENNVVSITTTAIQGAGGFGKTTLAIALCNDDDIIRFFNDGIIWVTLGQKKGEAIVAIKKIYDAITGENISFIDLETAQYQLAQQIKNKRCLVVVDDVWDRSDMEDVLKPIHDCKKLITTRFDNIITNSKVKQVQVSKMENQEGLDLLMAPLKDTINHIAPFEQLAKTLRYYPLLLKLVGRFLYQRIEGGEPAEHAINYLEKNLLFRA